MVSPGSSAGYYREMPQVPPDFKISAATVHHVPVILNFIRKLAEYEKLSHEVVVDEDALRKFLFGPRPAAEAVLAFDGSQPVGFAVFFTSYSTFAGRPGLFLEDLFVEPEYRGRCSIGINLRSTFTAAWGPRHYKNGPNTGSVVRRCKRWQASRRRPQQNRVAKCILLNQLPSTAIVMISRAVITFARAVITFCMCSIGITCKSACLLFGSDCAPYYLPLSEPWSRRIRLTHIAMLRP